MKKVFFIIIVCIILVFSSCQTTESANNDESVSDNQTSESNTIEIEEAGSVEYTLVQVIQKTEEYLSEMIQDNSLINFEIYQNDTMKEAEYFDVNLIFPKAYTPYEIQIVSDETSNYIISLNPGIYFRTRTFKGIELLWVDEDENNSYTREECIPEINYIIEKIPYDFINVIYNIEYKEESTQVQSINIELRLDSETPEGTLEMATDSVIEVFSESIFKDFISLI